MEDDFDQYQVDPRTTKGDRSGRYPRNYVNFPWPLRALAWGDALSRTGKPEEIFAANTLDLG